MFVVEILKFSETLDLSCKHFGEMFEGDSVDRGLSGGSYVCRPGSEEPYQCRGILISFQSRWMGSWLGD